MLIFPSDGAVWIPGVVIIGFKFEAQGGCGLLTTLGSPSMITKHYVHRCRTSFCWKLPGLDSHRPVVAGTPEAVWNSNADARSWQPQTSWSLCQQCHGSVTMVVYKDDGSEALTASNDYERGDSDTKIPGWTLEMPLTRIWRTITLEGGVEEREGSLGYAGGLCRLEIGRFGGDLGQR